jgi:hypothetical protein
VSLRRYELKANQPPAAKALVSFAAGRPENADVGQRSGVFP